MKANILDGKALAKEIRNKLQLKIAKLRESSFRAPHLAVILVGKNAPSEIYVNNKLNACKEIGVIDNLIRLPEESSEEELLNLIHTLNQDAEVDGILMQLPLPRHIDAQKILLAIDPAKDVDGFHPYNMGQLALKVPGLRPATPKGMMMMLEHYVGELIGLNAVVVGASNIVGRPMMLELLNQRVTVTICHSKTKDIAKLTREADILVAAVGIPHFITKEYVKPGAIVLDVGINRLADGQLVGDVDFEAVKEIAAWISPVPGGVGPMTIAGLLDNTVKAFEIKVAGE